MATVYINRRDENLRGTIKEELDYGVLLELEDGKERHVTFSTLKRWWKKTEVEEQGEIPTPEPTPEEAPVQEENPTPQPEEVPAPKKAKKERKKAEMTAEAKKLIEYAYAEVNKAGGEVWAPAKDIKMRAFKVDGHMFIKFNYSNKGITLHCRKAAVEELGEPTHIYNHCFNYAYTFEEYNKENKDMITKLIKKALKHQKAKKGGK